MKSGIRLGAYILYLVGLSLAVPARSAPTVEDACTRLNANNTIVRSATIETAAQEAGSVCVVRGEIISSPSSTIHFRLDLPEPSRWNTKLLMVGGGGFDGIVPTEGPQIMSFSKLLGADDAQVAGFARVSSDSGHQGRGKAPFADFSWVAGNPVAVRNHAYEANHAVLVSALDLSSQFYGKATTRRYIAGVSNGGRAGLVAIQHYPYDYDGVLSLEPAISQEGFAANLGPEMLQHIFSAPDHWLNAAQVALYERGELAACDRLDGLEDGILGDAVACKYDGANLLCQPGQSPSEPCLTSGQLESIRRIHADKKVPVTLADGWIGYAGFGRGGEGSDWVYFLFGPSFAARQAADYGLADNIVRWGITGDPNASVMTQDPTQWAPQFRALSDEIDATNPDLSAFYAHGGKLIVWHGVSDACVSYRQTARYLDTVKSKLGDQASRNFIRFYISPATGHMMAGAGSSTAPLLSTLEAWVEQGRAPQPLVSTLAPGSAKPGSTRPLCEYPLFPRYRGRGDPTKAASFVCSES